MSALERRSDGAARSGPRLRGTKSAVGTHGRPGSGRVRRGESEALLSAGSDGIDGDSPAAGAIADTTTIARARSYHFDPEETLAKFDSCSLFTALGDTIVTGPTGNNLRDLRVLLAVRDSKPEKWTMLRLRWRGVPTFADFIDDRSKEPSPLLLATLGGSSPAEANTQSPSERDG